MKATVVGLGYVGTMTPGRMSAHNHDVWDVGVSPDEGCASEVEALRGCEGLSR